MADNNKEIDKTGVWEDDDPTAELEAILEPVSAEIAADKVVEADSDDNISDFAGHDTEVGDADGAVISTEELQLAHEKQSHIGELLKKRDKEIESLRLRLSGKEQTLKEFAQQIADAKNKEQESESVNSKPALINHYEQDVEELRKSKISSRSQRKTSSTDAPRADAKRERHELALLVPLNGKASSEHPIVTGRLSMGSGPDNDICIKSEFISRHHAQIVSSSTDSILRDLNSTNGTYVNSKRIKRHALRNGDSITIGRNRFKYVEQNPGSSDFRKAALKEHT